MIALTVVKLAMSPSPAYEERKTIRPDAIL